MKLTDIVSTKFMPPTIKHGYKFGIQDTIHGWCSYVEQCGKKYWAIDSQFDSSEFFHANGTRKLFPSKEEAIRRCWKHFIPNKIFYPPQEKLNITKD